MAALASSVATTASQLARLYEQSSDSAVEFAMAPEEQEAVESDLQDYLSIIQAHKEVVSAIDVPNHLKATAREFSAVFPPLACSLASRSWLTEHYICVEA